MAEIDADDLENSIRRERAYWSGDDTEAPGEPARHSRMHRILDAAEAHLASLRAPKGELEEARAELGAWFLSNPGWSACYLVNSAGVKIGLQHYAGAQWWGGFKPTEAAAIRAALSRARGEGT